LKKLGISTKSGLLLGAVLFFFIFSNLGCLSAKETPVTPTLQGTIPTLTGGVTITTFQENLSTPSPTSTIQPANLSEPTASLPSDVVWGMLEQISLERAVTDLKKLTGEEQICIENECYTIKNRFTGSEGLQWAKDYLYKELTSLGYSVEYQDWILGGYSDQNLIARKVGVLHPDEKIYFVAHIDGKKKSVLNRFPAADDNASGAVDLLEVARVLSNYSFDRTLVFFFSTGEEEGTLGVRSYLQELSQEELSSIKYVVNVDMVGYDDDNDGVMELWHGDDPSSLALTQMMSETIQAYRLDLSPELIVGCG
jgi:hypothetical protein